MSVPNSPDHPPRRSSTTKIILILGVCLTFCCGGVVSVVSVGVIALGGARNNARLTLAENNLHQIGIALSLYETDNGELPPAVVYDAKGQPLYSWRVLLLPYIDEMQLDFHYDEPWDSPHNKTLLPRCPKVYRHPLASNPDPSLTYFRVFDGPGAAFESDPAFGFRPFGRGQQRSRPQITLRDFVDGTSTTFLVVEATDPVPWTKPDELPFAPDQPLPPLGAGDPSVMLVVFADSHTARLKRNTPENILRAYITRNGNDPVPGQ